MKKTLLLASIGLSMGFASTSNAWYAPGAYSSDSRCKDYGYMATCDYDGDGYPETQMMDNSYQSGSYRSKRNSRGQTWSTDKNGDYQRTPWND